MDNCIFCKIANHIIPSSIVYEDDYVMAFLDTSQVTKGHTLVIPKKHYDNFLSTPHDIVSRVMIVAQRVGQIFIKEFKAKGVNILTNCYEAAGQSVMHFHVHVIPRYIASDGFRLEFKKNDELKSLNLPAIANQIKENLDHDKD